MTNLETTWDGNVLTISGELDLASAAELEDVACTRADGRADVILDLAGVSFVDSTGVRSLVRIANRAVPCHVILRGARPNVRRLFELTGIEAAVPNLTVE